MAYGRDKVMRRGNSVDDKYEPYENENRRRASTGQTPLELGSQYDTSTPGSDRESEATPKYKKGGLVKATEGATIRVTRSSRAYPKGKR